MTEQPVFQEPVEINGKKYRPVREGLASILAPYQQTLPGVEKGQKSHNNDQGSQAVFYNPIQQFNRDLTVLAILTYGEGALAAKAELYAKKGRSRKARRKGKKGGTAVQGEDNATESRKRKLSETDHDDGVDATKKARIEADVDEENDLEITQLDGGGDGRNGLTDDPSSAGSKRLPFSILDALSATGLRALRYAKEIPFATNVIANDVSREAVEAIELNIDHNDVKDKVHSNVGDACAYMYSKLGNEHSQPSGRNVHRFDVVDLDPYGTAASFIDAALRCLIDGGMLCVTCTDAGVFASSGYLEKTFALYGGLPAKGAYSHETGLRLIISSIAQTAARYGLAVEPLLSLSIDFYARMFIRVHKRPNEVKLLAGTTMITYNCDSGCGAWTTQLLARNIEKTDKAGNPLFKHSFAQAPTVMPHCEHCGFKMHLGGPMWAGPLHNPHFVRRMLDKVPELDRSVYGTVDRLKGMLTLALEEDFTLTTSGFITTSPSPPNGASPTISTEPLNNAGAASQNGHRPATSTALIPRNPPSAIDPAPFLVIPNYIAKVLHAQTPSEAQMWSAIRSTGYRVTRSHCKAGSFKTDAPWSVIWEIMREWARTKAPIKAGSVKKGSPGSRILGTDVAAAAGDEGGSWDVARVTREVKGEVLSGAERAEGREDLRAVLRAALYRLEHVEGDDGNTNGGEPMAARGDGQKKIKISFDEKMEKPRGPKLVRYQINPTDNWGPMNRAGGS